MKEQRATIDIAKKIALVISCRDVAQKLRAMIIKSNKKLVDLDFKNVEFVSRSAAHEFLIMKEDFKKTKDVSFINTNSDVQNMLRIVAANRAVPQKAKPQFNAEYVDVKRLFSMA